MQLVLRYDERDWGLAYLVAVRACECWYRKGQRGKLRPYVSRSVACQVNHQRALDKGYAFNYKAGRGYLRRTITFTDLEGLNKDDGEAIGIAVLDL